MILGELQREYLARENTIQSLDMKPVQRMRVKKTGAGQRRQKQAVLSTENNEPGCGDLTWCLRIKGKGTSYTRNKDGGHDSESK